MALEDLTGPNKGIAHLVPANPDGLDTRSEGDNHIRGVKNALVNTFGAMLPNSLSGVQDGALLRYDAANGRWHPSNVGVDAVVFLGTIYGMLMWSATKVQPGWQLCDGQTIAPGTHAGFFAWLAANPGARVSWAAYQATQQGKFAYVNDDPAQGAKVPLLTGYFIRGANEIFSALPDNGRVPGSVQSHAVQDHLHDVADPGHSHSFSRGNSGFAASNIVTPGSSAVDGGGLTNSAPTGIGVGQVRAVSGVLKDPNESRPWNIALHPMCFVGIA